MAVDRRGERMKDWGERDLRINTVQMLMNTNRAMYANFCNGKR